MKSRKSKKKKVKVVRTSAVKPLVSAHHVCWALLKPGERSVTSPAGHYEACELDRATHEFFTNKSGEAIFRADIGDDLISNRNGDNGRAFNGPIRSYNQCCGTGWSVVKEVCFSLGCKVPQEVRDAEQRRLDYVQENYVEGHPLAPNQDRTRSGKGSKMPKGTKSGFNVTQAWAALFAVNEQRHAEGKKAYTDEKLIELMQDDFPDKADKTTITRCSMVRGCYNKGTNMFKNAGAAGVKGRPTSFRYDEKGEQMTARQRGAAVAAKADKKASKKVSKKKVSKKAASSKTSKKTSKKTPKKKASKSE